LDGLAHSVTCFFARWQRKGLRPEQSQGVLGTITIERKIRRKDNILNRMGNSVYITTQPDAIA
jgi:hypothetical protein